MVYLGILFNSIFKWFFEDPFHKCSVHDEVIESQIFHKILNLFTLLELDDFLMLFFPVTPELLIPFFVELIPVEKLFVLGIDAHLVVEEGAVAVGAEVVVNSTALPLELLLLSAPELTIGHLFLPDDSVEDFAYLIQFLGVLIDIELIRTVHDSAVVECCYDQSALLFLPAVVAL